jgi:hypothetical protein
VRRGLGSILDSDQVSNTDRLISHNRLDSISQRVAMIQAKLEIALAPIRDQMEAEEAENAEEGEEGEKDETENGDDKDKDKGSRPGTPDTVTTAKPPIINAPEGDGTPSSPSARSDDGSTPVTDTDHVDDVEVTKPPVLRAFVLRPPPRRVMQKRSYESIKSHESAITSPAVSTAHPTPVREEVIVTPCESTENLRHEDGLNVQPSKARPTSVGTIAFGTP